ncbi:3579_t:CDS:10 [Gigaspora margarita]|uniref:3579_t:CDS:1 n=1 Tax=Gigaspora margarita TaxID=4874 RepID=A0ABN7V538_GIGMA|nr:3579_t:CDS:10 [Gigaspora margarita]
MSKEQGNVDPKDNWEEDAEAEAMLVQKTRELSVKEFKLNTSAKEFVPSWLQNTTNDNPANITPEDTTADTISVNITSTNTTPANTTSDVTPADTTPANATPAKKTADKKPNATDQGADDIGEEAVDHEIVQDLYGKEHLNLVFIGHVGMVDQRTMEKYEKEAKELNRESWYLSWALDTGKEERAKVISARKGEFETGFERGGQTREHAVLAKTSGVNKLIVVINKMDDPTVNWSKERYDECVTKLTPFLKSSGYNPATDIEFMPVSAYTGANLKDRIAEGVCNWYRGPALLEYLDNMKALDRNIKAPLMMPITEKYKDMGTIVVGKIESGTIKKGQSVLIMPNKRTVEVSAIYNEVEEEVSVGACGDNVRLRVRGIEEEEISTGFVVCSTKRPVKTTTMFEAQLAILEHKNIMCAGYSAVLHIHSCVEEVSIAALLHLIDKKTGKKSKRPPQYVKKGQKVIARLETQGPICVEVFEEYQQLGRFTLRDEGKTIAIGKVTKVIEHE